MKRFLMLVISAVLLLAVGSSWYLSQPVMEGRLAPTLFEQVAVAPVDAALLSEPVPFAALNSIPHPFP